MKPLIGLSGSYIWEKEGVWAGYMKSYVNMDYPWSVEKAGGASILIPITEDRDVIKRIVSTLDGVILTGGHDVNPLLYNEDPKENLGNILPIRDSFDKILLEEALLQNKPVLGICRGFQFINVYFGGTLIQDLSYRKIDSLKHNQNAFPYDVTHTIKVSDDSFLKKAFNDEITVNSYHHQVIDKLAEGFKAVAFAPDGVIEAIEYEKDDKTIYAVQFHPEMLHANFTHHLNIFKVFMEKCRK